MSLAGCGGPIGPAPMNHQVNEDMTTLTLNFPGEALEFPMPESGVDKTIEHERGTLILTWEETGPDERLLHVKWNNEAVSYKLE